MNMKHPPGGTLLLLPLLTKVLLEQLFLALQHSWIQPLSEQQRHIDPMVLVSFLEAESRRLVEYILGESKSK